MNKDHEILAPAGTFEALVAAVQNGADAVYLSGKDFGARMFAGNFDRDELQEAVVYCHVRGVSLYVTVNTLVFNHEMDSLVEYLDFLYTIGIDAVIVQDMGVLQVVRRYFPDLDVHCSTQMSVQTMEDIKYLASLGVKRVVLGREMDLQQIRQAKTETAVQLEVFVHGALCISVSGQCLMSSMIGGRSGNRGRCAQPCRQKYRLYNEDKQEMVASLQGDYLLSPKDLSTLAEISQVVEAGAYSLKIEGRMKKPEYVAKVVRAYRHVLEAAEQGSTADMETMDKEMAIFNRGFTRGNLFGEKGLDFMSMGSSGNQGYAVGIVKSYDAKNAKLTLLLSDDLNHNDEIQLRRKDETVGGRVEKLELGGKVVKSCSKGATCQVNFKHACQIGEQVYKTYDEVMMKEARDTYHKEFLKIPVTMEITIKRGMPVTGILSDGDRQVREVSETVPQEAVKRALTEADVIGQLSKMGGTPYEASRVQVHLEDGLALPMKMLNEIRRNLVEQLSIQRANRYQRSSQQARCQIPFNTETTSTNRVADEISLTYSVTNLEQLEKLMELQPETIYYRDLDTLKEAAALLKKKTFPGQLVPQVNRMATKNSLEKYLNIISEAGIKTVLIQNLGHLHMFQDFKIIGDFNLNVINNLSYGYYEEQGMQRITLSPELTLAQIAAMNLTPHQTEIMGYGSLPVMAMKHCVIATVLGQSHNCHLCRQQRYSLVDRMNEHFPIRKSSGCNTEIYNSKKLMFIEDHEKVRKAGIGFFRLNFLDETPQEMEQAVRFHRNMLKGVLGAKDEEVIRNIKAKGVTNGHLYRGIE